METETEMLQQSPDEEEKCMSTWQRIIGIISSPSETMKDIALKPTFLFPILIVAFSNLLLYLARFSLFEEFMNKQTEMGMIQAGQHVPPEQLEQVLNVSKYAALVFTPLGDIFSWLIISVAFFLLVKLFKGEGSFKQYASIVGFSSVIVFIYILLSILSSFFTDELYLNTSFAAITNIFMPDLYGSFLYGILRGIDLFTIWYFVVIAIGVTKVSKLNESKIYLITCLLFAITISLSATGLRYM